MRGLNRGATLGAFDKKLQRTKKRALKLQEDHEARKIKSLVEYKNSNTENEYEEDSEEDFEDYLPPAQLPIKKRKITPKNKKECLPNTAYLIADKAGISDRNLTQLAAAIKQGDGEDLNDYNISVKTTARRRKILELQQHKIYLINNLKILFRTSMLFIGMVKSSKA